MTAVLDDHDLDASILVRTDFSNDVLWGVFVEEASAGYGPDQFSASLDARSDARFDGMSPEALALVAGSAHVVFVADATSMVASEKTLVVVDRNQQRGRSFRVVLPEAWSVENNLRLANMDFSEFAVAVGSDGVFRGFAS